jgi:uncharacterized protein RhaS with RHS repeats
VRISRDPIGEAGGMNLYAMVNNDPVNFYDLLGLILSEAECKKVKGELTDIQKTIDSLIKMLANWKSGETWKDYGLGAQANTAGYRSDDFSDLSQSQQDIVNEIESDHVQTAGWWFIQGTIGSAGYLSLGLHGLVHDTTAEEQWWTSLITIETVRKGLVLKRLQKVWDKEKKCCKELYGIQ